MQRPKVGWTPWLLSLGAVFGFGIAILLIRDEGSTRTQQICQAAVESRATLRSVAIAATTPGSSGPIVLPDDPTVDPDVIRYIERLIVLMRANPQMAKETQDRLLAEAPALRCTDAGVPVAIESSVTTTTTLEAPP